MSLSKREMQRAAMRERKQIAMRERARRCLELEDKGLPHQKIADEIGVSKPAVSRILLQIRPSRKKCPLAPEKKADLARQWIAGVPRRDISRDVGVSPRWVSALAKDMELPKHPLLCRGL